MPSSLVLFFEEKHGEDVDAQVFVTCLQRPKKRTKFYVYITRANVEDTPYNWHPIPGSRVVREKETPMVPIVTLTFISIQHVLNCLDVVFGLPNNRYKMSCEVHCTPNYNPSMNFKDLWAVTGPGTELGAYDDVRGDIVRFLNLLADSRVLEADMVE